MGKGETVGCEIRERYELCLCPCCISVDVVQKTKGFSCIVILVLCLSVHSFAHSVCFIILLFILSVDLCIVNSV